MKKVYLLTIVLFLCLTTIAFGQAIQWKSTNQATLAWDPVTTLTDGSPIPAGYTISYAVYYRVDGTQGVNVSVGNTTNTQYTVTFSVEGKFDVGIQANRFDSGGNIVSQSLISWSNDPAVTNNNPFGFIYYIAPANPKNLR